LNKGTEMVGENVQAWLPLSNRPPSSALAVPSEPVRPVSKIRVKTGHFGLL